MQVPSTPGDPANPSFNGVFSRAGRHQLTESVTHMAQKKWVKKNTSDRFACAKKKKLNSRVEFIVDGKGKRS